EWPTALNHTRPKPAIDPPKSMLRCGPSERTFASTAKSKDWRIHASRDQAAVPGLAVNVRFCLRYESGKPNYVN
ncbi:MAG: hypothetical protein ABJO67_14590, partial [Pseudoruegeria sp.]